MGRAWTWVTLKVTWTITDQQITGSSLLASFCPVKPNEENKSCFSLNLLPASFLLLSKNACTRNMPNAALRGVWMFNLFGTKQTFCLWPKQCYFRQSASWNLFKDKVQQAMPCFLILVQTGSLEGKSFTTLRFHMCVCIGVKIPLDFLSTFVPCVCVCACVRGKRPDFLSTFVPRVCVCVHACVRAKLAAINITMSERENLWDRVSLLCHQEKMFRYFSEKGDWKILCSCI